MFDKVKAIFEEQLGVSQDEMQLDTNFKDDLGVDSLDLYEIVMKMEDEFDVEIPAEELEDVATFEDQRCRRIIHIRSRQEAAKMSIYQICPAQVGG